MLGAGIGEGFTENYYSGGADITITGGKVNATGGDYGVGIGGYYLKPERSTIRLSWKNADDSIRATISERSTNATSYCGTVTLNSYFHDGSNVFPYGKIDSDVLENKTLVPYEVNNWSDLQTLINSDIAGNTITLDKNYTAESGDTASTVPSGKELTIDLNGFTLDRNLSAAAEDGRVIVNSGNSTIKDSSSAQTGTVTGAYYNGDGGAILNNKTATLNIKGGIFTGNTGNHGGVVYNMGTMNMTEGSMHGNTANGNGGAVYSRQDGTLNVFGSPVVKENGDKNIYLRQTIINVTDTLSSDAKLAVTNGLSGNGGADSFISDNKDYAVRLNNSGEAVLKTIYTITLSEAENGTVTGPDTACEGDTVTLTVTPDSGYGLSSLTVMDADNNEITVTDNKFTMPEGNVTVTAAFSEITYVPRVEPYVNDDGEYIPGNIEHYVFKGNYYAVGEDGAIGEKLSNVEVSDFEFEEIDGSYRINKYTGSTSEMTKLVIPKTYKGKKITTIGKGGEAIFTTDSPNFELVLNENITKISSSAFYKLYATKVTGDTSNLSTIGSRAFAAEFRLTAKPIDIKLDYPGRINNDLSIFFNRPTTLRLKHSTAFGPYATGASSLTYVFTDAHTYGTPNFNWADDYSSATAKFTCTDSRCEHEETVDAVITSEVKNGKHVFMATAAIDDKTYNDTKSIDLTAINYTYNVFDENAGQKVEKTVSKTVTPGDYSADQLIELNMPYIKSAYYEYSGYTYELSGDTLNVTINDTDKKYTVTLDGKEIGEYSYLETAAINLDEEKSFLIDGKVVFVGESYSFYVGKDTDITTDEPTDKSEYAYIDLNNYFVDDSRVSLDMLATANVGTGKFERMGVAFALSEKSEDEITAAVEAITTGSGTSNKIGVHNSSVDWYNRSGQYQFRYAPYFAKDNAKDRTIYFYTYVVTEDGIVISEAAQYNMSNLLA